jgi:hypothetical protein
MSSSKFSSGYKGPEFRSDDPYTYGGFIIPEEYRETFLTLNIKERKDYIAKNSGTASDSDIVRNTKTTQNYKMKQPKKKFEGTENPKLTDDQKQVLKIAKQEYFKEKEEGLKRVPDRSNEVEVVSATTVLTRDQSKTRERAISAFILNSPRYWHKNEMKYRTNYLIMTIKSYISYCIFRLKHFFNNYK